MLYWIIFLVFGVPLVAYIMNMRSGVNAREDRLNEIKERLHEKELAKVNAKWDRVKRKNQNQE